MKQLILLLLHLLQTLTTTSSSLSHLLSLSSKRQLFFGNPELEKGHPSLLLPAMVRPSNPDDKALGWPDFIKLWKSHHLTIGEIKYVYNLCDLDRDTKISQFEWGNFHRLFINPFQTVDIDANYLLNIAETETTLEQEEMQYAQLVAGQASEVMVVFDKHPVNGNLTFADYLFLRRANLAFSECAPAHLMSIAKIDCGLHITVPARRIDLPEARQIQQVRGFLKTGRFKMEESTLEFLDFLYISHVYHYFSNFEMPFVDGYLKKKDILRAVENQLLANQITEQVINVMFEQVNQMDFIQFTAQMWIYALYSRYKEPTDIGLNKEAFTQIMAEDNTDFPESLKLAFNNYIQPNEASVAEAGKYSGGGGGVTEKDFFVNYLQVNMKTKKKSMGKLKKKKQEEDEEIDALLMEKDVELHQNQIFNIMDSNDGGFIKYPIFVKFIKFSWFFINNDKSGNSLLTELEIKEGIKNPKLPIKITKEEKQEFMLLMQFLAAKVSFMLNIKQFLAYFLYNFRFLPLVVPGFKTELSRQDLEKGIKQMGFFINKQSIENAIQSSDPILGNSLFNYKLAFKNVLSDEIIAMKLIMNRQPEFIEMVKNFVPEEEAK